MATNRLQVRLDAVDNTKQAFNQLQGRLSKVRQSVFNLRNAFIGLGAAAVVRGFVKAGIQIENLEVQLKALFGSAKAGRKALEEVTKFAATTPFELENIQQGVTALATVRERAEEAGVSFEDLLLITGNTAAQIGGDFALASLQIQRAFSGGAAAADTFRDRGILAMAGFEVGARVSVDKTIKKFNEAFGRGGKFGNLTEELAKTLFGTVSNIKDAFFQFQVAVAEGFFGELKKQLGDIKNFAKENEEAIKEFGNNVGVALTKIIQGLGKATKFVAENFETIKNIFIAIVAIKIISFIRNLTIAMAGLNAVMLANPIFLGIAGVSAAIIAITTLITKFDDFKKSLKEARQELEKINLTDLTMAMGGVGATRGVKGKIMPEIFVKDRPIFTPKGQEKDKKFLDKLLERIKAINAEVKTGLEKSFENINELIGKGIVKGIQTISKGIAESIVLGKKLGDVFRNIVQQVFINLIAKLVEFIALEVFLIGKKKIEELIDKRKTAEVEKQNKKLKQQLAIETAIAAVKAFSGGGFGGFAEGGQVKARANGGAVGMGQAFMVGERGRELFIPNQDGEIVSNERLQQLGTNVNFTINATDVRGVKELLIDNRAVIVNIVNSALNQKGKAALV